MSEEHHPTEGVRLLIKRLEVSEDGQYASYSGAVFTVTERFDYELKLSGEGSAEMQSEAPATPEDEKKLKKMAQSIARASRRKSADGLAPWPPRVLRWRGPGRG